MRRKEKEFVREAIEAYSKLSGEEKHRINVRAGIYTPDGRLTKRYGGDAPNLKERQDFGRHSS